MARQNVIEIIINGKDKASPSLLNVGKNLKTIGKAAMAGMATVGTAVAGAGAALAKFALDAAPLEGLEAAFGDLAERIGTSSEEMMAGMEQASAGMIAQRDIMKSVNLAASLVGDSFAEEMPRAMEALTKASAATGESMDYMMDSLVRGVGRVSPLILDNLGVQMDMNKALEDYAEEHGIKAAQTLVDNSEAITDLNEKLGFAGREMGALEQAYHDANAEFIHAQEIWPKGSVELNKFQARVEKAQLAMDKKSASIADMQGKLQGLHAEHGQAAEDSLDLTKVLSKEEQQMALLDQVVGKLEDKYKDMPPVTENVATKVAAMQAKFQNFKDEIGKALLPILGSLMNAANKLADWIMPLMNDFISTKLVPTLEKLGFAFGFIYDQIMSGRPDFIALQETLEMFLPPEIVDKIYAFAEGIMNLIDTVRPYIEQAAAWIAQNVKLEDVLIALGIAIATVVVPIIASIVASIGVVVATFVGLVAIISLLRKAWETDWHGIRTTLTEFWENTAKPAFEQLVAWLQVNIPIAIETLKGFWEDTLLPALQNVWAFINESVLPILADVGAWLQEKVPIAIQTLADFWTNTLLPAIQDFWTFMQESIFPLLQKLWIWLQEKVPIAIQTLSDFWTNTLLPALQAVWAYFSDSILPIFIAVADVAGATLGKAIEFQAALWKTRFWPALQKVWAFFNESILPILNAVADVIGNYLQFKIDALLDALGQMGNILSTVAEKLSGFADKIRGLELPEWLRPGSATPFEEGLRGVAAAIVESLYPSFVEFMDMLMERWMALAEYLLVESWPLMQQTWFVMTEQMRSLWILMVNDLIAAFQEFVSVVMEGIDLMISKWEELADALKEIEDALGKVEKKLKDITGSDMLGRLDKLIEKFEDLAEAAREAASAMESANDASGGGLASAQSGMYDVPHTGPMLVHKGEMILPSWLASMARQTTNYFNLTVNTRAETSPVIESFETMRALVG